MVVMAMTRILPVPGMLRRVAGTRGALRHGPGREDAEPEGSDQQQREESLKTAVRHWRPDSGVCHVTTMDWALPRRK
jgi:hypothetical protein